jgi:phage terminase large subunit-like protein
MGLRGIGGRPIEVQEELGENGEVLARPWEMPGLSRPERVRAFIEHLTITSGIHAGKKFILRDWQWKQIILPLYQEDSEGRRLKRQALITMPRKNGKTGLAAALALCHLCGPEAEPRGQVYSAASDRKQAMLIMKEMVAMIRADPHLYGRIIVREHNKTLEDSRTRSTYEALSSDARRAHGINVSFAVMDELAQWLRRDLYDALITAGAARKDPLFVTISTQSADNSSVMSELVQYGRRILDGQLEDKTFLPVIFSAPDDADIWDEKVWFAANPALGDFRSLEEMRMAAEQAKALPARESSFRNLYLNQAVNISKRFISFTDWQKCKAYQVLWICPL